MQAFALQPSFVGPGSWAPAVNPGGFPLHASAVTQGLGHAGGAPPTLGPGAAWAAAAATPGQVPPSFLPGSGVAAAAAGGMAQALGFAPPSSSSVFRMLCNVSAPQHAGRCGVRKSPHRKP